MILHVNGNNYELEVDPNTPLLYVLRNQLKLNGPKYGCGLSQCGACMVLINGKATTSCSLLVKNLNDSKITTLEGLLGKNGELHKVQKAFVDEQAAQCGYCLNGLIIAAVDLLTTNKEPDDFQIRAKLNQNICRCGVHTRAIKAIKRAYKK
ncbi:(2Fe-2S)-binding protein [Maribacter sp. X9]|uniref:(2Fe-2S)-binding protein n=1 Tax=Maribacter sp. X9 TaxID=3402159 RepID=UPI003AF4001D